ncbi:catechol 2,3-dioxygenase [Alkalibacterium subtropicum]|uniref:Catechol 2,3-dioxygenase n=1 Tax=Alkalibacterium subtropicum TaxID=753702 RepID=A0A1I1GW47_9LACT|nr:VOC family protein [Alkalibacterium subtropicum]SFC15715.1 catechol 2,3-dioxygenase [Alkalibacterium subtropicum]
MTNFAIDKNLSIHSVDLNVEDLEKMTTYYKDKIGLSILEQSANQTALGTENGKQVLINLIKTDTKASPMRKAGLFHTAFLVPTRRDLGNVLFGLLKKEVPVEGASDHGYSEAIYLTDPEGNGIEIYRDKPQTAWDIEEDGTIRGVTEQMDAEGVLASRTEELVDKMPEGTKIGHVHLSVSDLKKSQAFYIDGLGMQLKYEFGSQARFIAAADYHHHLGLNTWLGVNIPEREQYDIGLTRFTLALSSAVELEKTKEHFNAEEISIKDSGENFVTVVDPNGIRVTLITA